MEFLLKKIISIFIMPLSIGILTLLLGLVFLYKNNIFKAKIALSFSFIWFFLISYSPLVNALLYPYENIYPTLKIAPKNIEYIYVLGGGHHTNNNHPITSEVNSISLVRLSEAIRLYKQMDKKPIIIVSGHKGFFDPNSHAFMQKNLAIALGVKDTNIHLCPTPKDTQDEAKEAKKYIKNRPFILVTSASHIKRALNLFKEQNLNPIPAPTNHIAHTLYPNYLGFFSASSLEKSTILWHELIGNLWNSLKKY